MLVCALSMLAGAAAPVLADIDRAVRNYQAVVNGARPLSALSPEEVRELVELDARLRTPEPDRRSLRQRCIDAELARLSGEPSELALRTIDLKCGRP